VPEWLTIEAFDGEVPASGWRRAHESALVEAAVTNGASFWDWHATRWGVVLELLFDSDDRVDSYRRLPVVRAALDGVPDPAHGLVIYRGRGGGAGAFVPRHPRPAPVAGAAPWPGPEADECIRQGTDPSGATREPLTVCR
jgi:hypothetical protein